MKNYDFKEKKFQFSHLLNAILNLLLAVDIKYGNCICRCVEILKEYDN